MKGAILLFSLLILLNFNFLSGQQNISLIPEPQFMEMSKGVFKISSATTIAAPEKLYNKAKQLKNYLEPALGYELKIVSKPKKKNIIELKLDKNLDQLGEEAYKLEISPDKIIFTASTEKGIFWGIQTLRQLLPDQILREAPVKGISWEIPCLTIEDSPRFNWRGLMLDCSRTFITKEQIKKYIEVMSFFKMNTLHLHLTDDQGWRLEIKKYPELTQICSKFHKSFEEPEEYQGYYSQEDMIELIGFAAQRNIEIVPEIEMPGHTSEVFAAFPNLSCIGDTVKIHPWSKGYFIHNEILCAGNEETFVFLENVLSEVVALFPSEYIHIGGDEAPKRFWKECPKCQKRIITEGLKDEDELQSWFVSRIEEYLNSKGKKLIGWDEIMKGGLSETATVMYWRGQFRDTPKKIAEQGNKMVMTPNTHCYFNHPYDRISSEKVYSFNPVQTEIAEEYTCKVLGVQASFWSHIDRTPTQIDRQLFPRLLALSEVAWTNNDKKDWDDFKLRLQTKLNSLDIMGLYYYKENY
jgi:hexosaminidase